MPQLLKILFLIDSLGSGGAERSIAELLPRLRGAAIDARILCLYSRHDGVEENVRAHGYRVEFLESGSFVRRAAVLRRILTTTRTDILHTSLFNSNQLGRCAAVGTGTRVLSSLVTTPYDPVRLADPRLVSWKIEAVKRVDSITSRLLTHHFHAVTHAVKDHACRHLGVDATRVTVIERGRDRARLGHASAERREAVRRTLGLAADQPVVLTVGRQEFQKGHRHLLDAMRGLVHKWPALVLLVAGREDHATPELLRLREQYGLGSHVRLLGHRHDVPDLLAGADVFAFPSLYEGLGGAMIEAMALHVPVVASRISAIEEVIRDGIDGLLVEPQNPAALAAAIDSILADDRLGGRLGAAGGSVFEQRFGLERYAARMIELYQRMIELYKQVRYEIRRLRVD